LPEHDLDPQPFGVHRRGELGFIVLCGEALPLFVTVRIRGKRDKELEVIPAAGRPF